MNPDTAQLASTTPTVARVAADSPAEQAGVRAGDQLVRINGVSPRDIIAYQLLIDEDLVHLDVLRPDKAEMAQPLSFRIEKGDEPLGIEVNSALFDQVRTCDNHCEFCFIYQLPKGMRKSLYLKDDDYRLSFLYGNFTTLTRFTEADLERVLSENLSPLYVSIHATDPTVRSDLLRNPRGATSLRWLKELLAEGITVHGQLVVCPGLNDGNVLVETLSDLFDEYAELASVAVVPLGISRYSHEDRMREHTLEEATFVVDAVEYWQSQYHAAFGRRTIYAADEYYLLSKRPFPPAAHYEGFPMHEDGIGLARSFLEELVGNRIGEGVRSGFFASVDAPAVGYRAPRTLAPAAGSIRFHARKQSPAYVLTGVLGAQAIGDAVHETFPNVTVLPVTNEFFGGNVGVTGLLTGADLSRELAELPETARFLLPDVCLSGGRFLDNLTPEDLPRPVEVLETTGTALRQALLGAA